MRTETGTENESTVMYVTKLVRVQLARSRLRGMYVVFSNLYAERITL